MRFTSFAARASISGITVWNEPLASSSIDEAGEEVGAHLAGGARDEDLHPAMIDGAAGTATDRSTVRGGGALEVLAQDPQQVRREDAGRAVLPADDGDPPHGEVGREVPHDHPAAVLAG